MTALFAAMLALAAAGAAAQEMQGDRPDFPESTVTVPVRSLQIEGGYTFRWLDGDSEHVLGELLLRWGVLEWMELRFAVNSLVWSINGGTSLGKDDPMAGVKVQLLQDGGTGPAWIPDITLTLGGTVPVGFGDPHESPFRPEAGLHMGWTLGGAASLNVSGVYSYDSDDGRRYHRWVAGTALWIAVTDRLDCYAEYTAEYPRGCGGNDAHYAGAGGTFLLLENFVVDLRAGLRLDRRREYLAGIGFVGRMDDLY